MMLAVSVHDHSYLVGMFPGLMVSGIGHGMICISMFDGGTRDVDNHNRNDPLTHAGVFRQRMATWSRG